jgi:hypothetical protein
MKRETTINAKGQPRTKGIRSAIQQYAVQGTKGGPMRAKQDRRSQDARRSWKQEVWS